MCEYCKKGEKLQERENDNIYTEIIGKFLYIKGKLFNIPLGRIISINYCPMCRKKVR